MSAVTSPDISIVILNYNGARWLDRCLASIHAQTCFDRIEVIIADNLSTDGSDRLSEELVRGWSNGRFVQNGANLGFCEGNNRGARGARGRYLLFLNNDTWLEPDCLERLLVEVKATGAAAATPIMFNYDDDSVQSAGGAGFDVFGLLSRETRSDRTLEIFTVGGCSYLIEQQLFWDLGGFDPELFMYADEYDLTWRVWLAGHRAVLVPSSRLHHRGAPNVNPKGGSREVEFRTSEAKRYYSNRNGLVVVLKNAQHILLLLAVTQLFWLLFEGVVLALLTRRLSVFSQSYVRAIRDCWRMRPHILRERERLARLRKASDWRLLRFLCVRLNRWDEFRRMLQLGMPRVDG